MESVGHLPAGRYGLRVTSSDQGLGTAGDWHSFLSEGKVEGRIETMPHTILKATDCA